MLVFTRQVCRQLDGRALEYGGALPARAGVGEDVRVGAHCRVVSGCAVLPEVKCLCFSRRARRYGSSRSKGESHKCCLCSCGVTKTRLPMPRFNPVRSSAAAVHASASRCPSLNGLTNYECLPGVSSSETFHGHVWASRMPVAPLS